MLLIISPAKKLSSDNQAINIKYTYPDFLEQSEELITVLRNYSPAEISDLMNISANLAQLNYERYHTWHKNISPDNAVQALFLFNGDVYQGTDARTLSDDEIMKAQKQLRILSGLYGLLRPLDLILPHRLEMGTKLATSKGKNLYDFWRDIVTEHLNKAIKAQGDNILINLASDEYFKVIKKRDLDAEIITPVFKDYKNGKYKVISFYAKKARGLMVRYLIQNEINTIDDIRGFDLGGYVHNPELSEANTLVFTRG